MVRFSMLLLFAAFLALGGCGRDGAGRESREQPLGGDAALDALIAAAQGRAAPEGAVLVVLWRTADPPPAPVRELVDRWSPYGLATIGVCLDLVGAPSAGEALAAVRAWEKRNRVGMPSLLFEGSAAAIEARFESRLEPESAAPFLILFDPDGKRIWSGRSFQEIEDLDAILQVRLGLPPLAGREEGCVC